MSRLRVLVVNHDGPQAEQLAERLSAEHSALPAGGFEEACEALVVQKFDAVLLGAQLPADGVQEFTAKLRELERSHKNAAPAPVLSLSAHVPDGKAWCAHEKGVTREQGVNGHPAVEAPVDGYLAESFQPAVFLEAVTSLAGSIARCSGPSAQADPQLPVFEPDLFRDHVARDEDLMREIIDLFLGEAPSQIIELREAIASADFKLTERVAHTIKGSLATLHAEQARSRAQKLELAAKSADPAHCREFLSALEYDLEVLEPRLLALRAAQ